MPVRRPPGRPPAAEEHTEITQKKDAPAKGEHTVRSERPGPPSSRRLPSVPARPPPGEELPYQTGTDYPAAPLPDDEDATAGESLDELDDLAAGPGVDEPPAEYQTAGAYQGDEDDGALAGEGDLSDSQGRRLTGEAEGVSVDPSLAEEARRAARAEPEEEDIYGEDDALPEPDDFGGYDDEQDASDGLEPSHTRARRAETHIMPATAEGESGEGEVGESTHVGRPVKLEILEGPDKGRVKRFNGVRMVVGRAPGVDLRLSDASVSRRHLELVQGDQGVLLRDLGSGNGTRVNDEKATEQLLQHQDEIALGKTVMRFFDAAAAARLMEEEAARKVAEEKAAAEAAASEAAAPEAAAAESAAEAAQVAALGGGAPGEGEGAPEAAEGEAEAGAAGAEDEAPEVPLSAAARLKAGFAAFRKLDRRRQLFTVGAAAAGLLVLVGAVWLVVGALGRPAAPPSSKPLWQTLEDARAAMVLERFGEAIQLLAEAEAMQKGSDPQGLANALQNELDAEAALIQVKALLDAGRFEEAREALALVPEASARLDDVRERFAAEIDKRELASNQRKLEDALEGGDITLARTLVEALPEPLRAEATKRVDASEVEWKEKRTAAEQRAAEAREAADKRREGQRKAFIASAFSAVERKFDAGDYTRAVLECDRAVEQHRGDQDVAERARALKNLIPAFVSAYEDAERKLKQGGVETAVRPLKRARELYSRIGFGGALGGIIDGKLASASLSAARSQVARNDLPSALESFREALRLNPGDERAQMGISQLERRGEELYREAYQERERDPRSAMAKLRIVLEITAAGSSTHRQARTLLSDLTP